MSVGDAEVDLMVERVIRHAEVALVATVNTGLEAVYEDAVKHAPKSENHAPRVERGAGGQHQATSAKDRPTKPLAERGHVQRAEVGNLGNPVGSVSFEGPYAAAQEVGKMVYKSRGGKAVEWEVHEYTTPGTGAHYLSNALKLVAGGIEGRAALHARMVFGDVHTPGIPITVR